jgi:hypothetical protein
MAFGGGGIPDIIDSFVTVPYYFSKGVKNP